MDFLYSALAPQSRNSIKALLTHSQIMVNGRVSRAFDLRVRVNDEIAILPKSAEIEKKKVRDFFNNMLKIVYEDDFLIVADKAGGLPTVSTRNGSSDSGEREVTAYSLLTGYVRMADPRNRIFIVHRIDRDTSGLLLFAKDEVTKAMLQKGWNENIIERKYVCMAEGCPPEKSGQIKSWLTENPKSLKISSSSYDNGGKLAITDYNVLACSGGYSLISLELETGRKNQIRIHLSSIGHPIAGDRKYGARTNPLRRLALHAQTLAFRHPHTGEILRFTSEAGFSL